LIKSIKRLRYQINVTRLTVNYIFKEILRHRCPRYFVGTLVLVPLFLKSNYDLVPIFLKSSCECLVNKIVFICWWSQQYYTCHLLETGSNAFFFLPLNGQIILKLSYEINFSCYLHVVISDLILIVTRDKAKLFILSKKDEENKSWYVYLHHSK
jgi:hypothetical protein